MYICANTEETIEFDEYGNAKISYQLIDSSGNKIGESFESIYSVYNKLSTDKTIPYSDRYNKFYENFTSLKGTFVGDKFYVNN